MEKYISSPPRYFNNLTESLVSFVQMQYSKVRVDGPFGSCLHFFLFHPHKHLTKRGTHITSRITNYFNPAAASSLPTHHLTSDGLPLVKKISTLACLPLPVHCCQGTNNPGSVDYSLISLMQLTRYFKSEFGSVSGQFHFFLFHHINRS